MSLITTCPACGTSFRITPEQLSAHHGDVRCGQCQHIFSALKQLAEVEPPQPAPSEAPAAETPVGQVPAPLPAEADFLPAPDSTPPPEPYAGLHIETLEEITEEIPHAFPAEDEPLPIATEIEPDVAVGETLVEQRETGATPPMAEPPVEEIVLGSPEPAPEPPPTPASQNPPPFSGRRARKGSPWLWMSLALLLALSAAIQGIYFLRSEIAAHFPWSKPGLAAACARLNCSIELPRQADLLSIEDSDLQDDPEHAGVLVLVSTLYNRAPYAQAYPLLELTLTDTFDKPVLRRTLTPLEYLSNNAGLAAGIPAGGETSIRLNLTVTGPKPAGYRLYVRY